MKHMKDVLPSTEIESQKTGDKLILNPLCSSLVDQVFIKIALICRGFDAFYADRTRLNAEKMQWVLAFTKLGYTEKSHIKMALHKLELHKYPNPPQLGEFISWCTVTANDFGLPAFEEAYKISIQMNRQFSDYQHECDKTHTVIKHAIRTIGNTDYRAMDIDSARKAFERNYEIACRQFMNGELKEIPKAIAATPNPHPQDKERNALARKEAMLAMKKTLGLKS